MEHRLDVLCSEQSTSKAIQERCYNAVSFSSFKRIRTRFLCTTSAVFVILSIGVSITIKNVDRTSLRPATFCLLHSVFSIRFVVIPTALTAIDDGPNINYCQRSFGAIFQRNACSGCNTRMVLRTLYLCSGPVATDHVITIHLGRVKELFS